MLVKRSKKEIKMPAGQSVSKRLITLNSASISGLIMREREGKGLIV